MFWQRSLELQILVVLLFWQRRLALQILTSLFRDDRSLRTKEPKPKISGGSREGRHPPGHRGHHQRPLGPLGQAAQQARVAGARRHGTGTAGVHDRLPLHPGRHHEGGGDRAAEEGQGGQGREGREAAQVWVSGLHHPSWSVVLKGWDCLVVVTVEVAGWIGYSNETLTELCEKYLELGFTAFKLKVGKDFQDDVRRLQAVRNIIGWENKLVSSKCLSEVPVWL